MKDNLKLFLFGLFTVLACIFAVVSKVSIPVMLILIVLKITGGLSLSWGVVVIVPPVFFILGTFLQATCVVMAKVYQ